jgi:hypothetical protein
MELIPILSTIILVATICTFILAIGAYILYKIRERRGEQVPQAPPSSVRAELVTPDETEYRSREYVRTEERNAPVEPRPVKTASRPGVYPGSREDQGAKPRYYPEAEKYERVKTERTTGKKFLKYTSEGYVPTEEDKNPGVLKWR